MLTRGLLDNQVHFHRTFKHLPVSNLFPVHLMENGKKNESLLVKHGVEVNVKGMMQYSSQPKINSKPVYL